MSVPCNIRGISHSSGEGGACLLYLNLQTWAPERHSTEET